MKKILEFFWPIVLIILRSAVCRAYSCHYNEKSDSSFKSLTFICAEDTDNANYFEDAWSECPGQYGFYKQHIEIVNFQDCQVTELQQNSFKFYSNLHTFDISGVGLKTLKQDDFATQPRSLNTLIASKNQLTELSAHLFDDASRLLHIDLSSNEITKIDPDAFPDENRLEILDLSFNNISELTVKTFQKLSKLQKLFLTNNKIAELPPFLFHKTKQLDEIDLSSNQIRTIDYFAFSGAMNLNTLNLANNRLTALNKQIFDKRCKLKHLDISNNQFKTLSTEIFDVVTNLAYFDSSNNSIGAINKDSFETLVNLNHLNLSYNFLSIIKPGTFSRQTKLQTLDLSNNRITVLNTNILPTLANRLKVLSIAHNQVQELVDFTSDHIPNARITGIDSNHLNCLHFGYILESFTPEQLDAFSKTPNCSGSRTTTVDVVGYEHTTPDTIDKNEVIVTIDTTESVVPVYITPNHDKNELINKTDITGYFDILFLCLITGQKLQSSAGLTVYYFQNFI